MSGWQPIEAAPRDGTHVLLFATQRPHDMLAQLDAAIAVSGRSLAAEVEARLALAFQHEDLRQIIRDEVRAAFIDMAGK